METKSGYFVRAKHILISPFKMRRVANVVRGKDYSDAVATLENLPQKGAKYIKKAILSAAANALFQNNELDEDMLYVKELWVDEGPRMRRIWVRGRGRRDVLLKRMSHISVILEQKANKGA